MRVQEKRLTPKAYNGAKRTSHFIRALLPSIVKKCFQSCCEKERELMVLQLWSVILPPKIAFMTKATQFRNGTLTVRVQNSVLYDILAREQKAQLLEKLQQRLPQFPIRTIRFFRG